MFLNGATSSVSLSRARAPSFVQRFGCSAVLWLGGGQVMQRIDAASVVLQPGGSVNPSTASWERYYELSGRSLKPSCLLVPYGR